MEASHSEGFSFRDDVDGANKRRFKPIFPKSQASLEIKIKKITETQMKHNPRYQRFLKAGEG